MIQSFSVDEFRWINEPKTSTIGEQVIQFETEPGTDYWQRTYYGFRNDNAHTLLLNREKDFTFTIKTEFKPKMLFDQCGIIIYQDSDTWCKASIESEDDSCAKLGSVVTNMGYSDWASSDIAPDITTMWYRLSRRGDDFLIENSSNGKDFKQMRIFHIHKLSQSVQFGLYACSPLNSSFTAKFSELSLTESIWQAHEA